MSFFGPATAVFLGLLAAKWFVELWLERLNRCEVLAHADTVPEGFKGIVDEATYAKSVQYTLAKSKFYRFEISYHSIVLLIVVLSGLLPWGLSLFSKGLGGSAWAMAAYLFACGVVMAMPGLPLD